MTGEQRSVSFSQEFRLGLVVYGGVSLAIYMNGVCREFYEAVRGRGIYKLIKALTDSDIIVDIVSGTSAGGINGVLLSYALTNSTKTRPVEFSAFANIWRNSGDINELLRPVDPFKVEAETNSVLDGEQYYQHQLFCALQKATAYQPESNPEQDWYSESSELDLFVTGTDVIGKVYYAFDNTGQAIDVKEHRSVFHLKHRQGRKHPFAATLENQTALAKLCRITSCFPVAFPVVSVNLDDPKSSDVRLVEWGDLKNRFLPPQDGFQQGRQLHFVDGGVLDNRPFGYTIQEIYYRTAYRPVSRKLFYIDPSPDRFIEDKDSVYWKMSKPNLLKVVGDSLVSMPRYESIANDLKAIEEHNQSVRRYRRLAEAVKPLSAQSRTTSNASDSEAEHLYLRCRFIQLRDHILPLILQTEKFSEQGTSEEQIRHIRHKRQVLDRAAALLTRAVISEAEQTVREDVLRILAQRIRNLDVEYALRKHFFLLEQVWQRMETLIKTSPTNRQAYQELQFLAGDLSKQIELLEVVRSSLNYLLQLDAVNQNFQQLLESVEQQMQAEQRRQTDADDSSLLEQQPIYRIYDHFLRLHRFLLDSRCLEDYNPPQTPLQAEQDGSNLLVFIPKDFLINWPDLTPQPDQTLRTYGLSTPQISSIYKQLQKRAEVLEQGQIQNHLSDYPFKGDENANEQYQSILRCIELRSEFLIQTHCNRIQNLSTNELKQLNELIEEFRQFRDVDQVLYSYEYLANFRSKETIELVRISPGDAKRGFSEGFQSKKLAGDQLGAFGGFFKRSWRSNDILWGRLDGFNRIVDALLTPESLSHFSGFVQRQLGEPINTMDWSTLMDYLQQLLEETLPVLPTDREKNRLLQLLEKLARDEGLSEGTDGELEELRNILVNVGHRAIVETDLNRVFQDDIEEELNWQTKQYTPPQPAANGPASHPECARFEPSMNSVIAESMTQDLLKQVDKSQFFRDPNRYKIGSETVASAVPETVLKYLAARTSLILRNVLVDLFPTSNRNQFRRSGIYQAINRSLQVFYVFVQRKTPPAVQRGSAQKVNLLNLEAILLGLILIGVVVLLASLVALFLKLPIWGLALIGAAILLVSTVLLRWT